jgi:hypothetical protein
VAVPASLTTFSYLQTDNVTGAGTIAAPDPTNFGGVLITWSATAMPATSLRDREEQWAEDGMPRRITMAELAWTSPSTGTPTLTTAGASSPAPLSVTLFGNGDDGNAYSVRLSLVFFGDNVLPDEHIAGWGNNDFHWSLDYGGILGANPRTRILVLAVIRAYCWRPRAALHSEQGRPHGCPQQHRHEQRGGERRLRPKR